MSEPGSAAPAMRGLCLEHFAERFQRYGPDVKSVWNRRVSQIVRFDMLTAVGDLDGKTVLDVGCGLGDLAGYLAERGVRVARYTGVDLLRDFVDVARKRFSFPWACFREGDFLDLELEPHDYVLASGLFGLRSPDWLQFVRAALHRMAARARLGVACNFLGNRAARQDPSSYYADPAAILAHVLDNVGRRCAIVHGYLPNDFTLYVYPAHPVQGPVHPVESPAYPVLRRGSTRGRRGGRVGEP